MKKITVHNPVIGDTKCILVSGSYPNGNLAVLLYEADSKEFYSDLTVNLGDMVPLDCAYIDVNNLESTILKDLESQEIAVPYKGIVKRSGFSEYPLYQFKNLESFDHIQ